MKNLFFIYIFMTLNCNKIVSLVTMVDYTLIDFEEGLEIFKNLNFDESIQGPNGGLYYVLQDSSIFFSPNPGFFNLNGLKFISFKNMKVALEYMKKDYWFEYPYVIWDKHVHNLLEGAFNDGTFINSGFNQSGLKIKSDEDFLNIPIKNLKKMAKRYDDNYFFFVSKDWRGT